MAILGFNFLKLSGERKSRTQGGTIEINHNISITDLEKTSLNVGSNKNEVLRIEFKFNIIYGNNLGEIELVGDVIYADTKEILEETFKKWKAEKKITSLVNMEVLKFVYSKSIIKVLDIADSLNLPSPIPMPNLNFENKDNSKKTSKK